MVRVLMFGWEFPPFNSGGLGTACQGLTRGLSSCDVEVVFVLPRKVDVDVDFMKVVYGDDDRSSGSVSRRYVVNSLLHGYVTSASYDELSDEQKRRYALYASSLSEEVHRYGLVAADIASREDFDVIHAHDWLTFPAALQAKRVSGKALVIHVHATEFDRTGGNGVNQMVYDIEREGMHEADLIITVSEFTKRKVVKHYGVSADKVRVVHNAVEFADQAVEQFHHLKEHKKIVLFLGRLTLQKGPDYFVGTAKRVLEFYPDVLFVVAGSGDMQHEIIDKVAAMGLSDKFVFTGFLRGSQVRAAYQMADLYVMPSVSEPFGITPLEAMYVNTPALMSKQSGVSEVVSNALKSDFWDVDEMANKIVSVLKHEALGETLKKNGKVEVDNLSWDKPARRVVDIYEELNAKKEERS